MRNRSDDRNKTKTRAIFCKMAVIRHGGGGEDGMRVKVDVKGCGVEGNIGVCSVSRKISNGGWGRCFSLSLVLSFPNAAELGVSPK